MSYMCRSVARTYWRGKTKPVRCARPATHMGPHDYRTVGYILVRSVVRGAVWGVLGFGFLFLMILSVHALAAFVSGW